MTSFRKNIKIGLLIFILGYVSFEIKSQAWAQSNVISDEAAILAIDSSMRIKRGSLLTENIETLGQLNIEALSSSDRLRHLRQYAYGTITLSNNLDQKEVLSAYKEIVERFGSERDKGAYQLHEMFLDQIDLSKAIENPEIIIYQLDAATENPDWFIASNAWLLKSILNAYANNPNVALQEAHEAYRLIPNEISPYVTDARILILVHTTHLNNLLLNPELAIENTNELIKQKQAMDYPIDGSSLLNNLLYSLSNWREYEVSSYLAQTVLEIEAKVGSNTPGLTELRVAQLYDRQSKFKEALQYSRLGLEHAEINSIKESLQFIEINALIGLGSVRAAKQKLLVIKGKKLNTDAFHIRLARAELGLAISEKDESKIYTHLNHLLDLTTQSLLQSYNTNTSKLLAGLENTKERQAEREAGLKREAEQKTRTNQLLMVLVGLLSLAAMLAVIFARYRYNISKKLAIKTAQAEDADRMKSEFLGMVSHELRTPLNGIVGIADLLAMQAPNDDLRHKAGIILDSSNKLTHVIESIVDMSSIDGDKMELYTEPTDIHSVVMELDTLWRPTLGNKGVTFTSFVEDSLADEIILDKSRFRQCLNNLLSNAVKFTDNGRVHLHVTSKFISETQETEVTAIIADTGQGMSEDVQDKLFTPFLQADSTMTRKHGGSGLGLAITQSLARMMGGDVTMVSALGRGSEFTLTIRGKKSEAAQILDDVEALMDTLDMTPVSTAALPQNISSQKTSEDIVEPSPTPATASVEAEEITLEATAIAETKTDTQTIMPHNTIKTDDLRGLKVLIVEDNPANQDVIKLFLNPEGCQSQCVVNGIEALDVLNTQAIDIILMDIRMPEMDGIEATRAIRSSGREYKNTPIIALTADASAETNAACMAAGADIFLTKPIMAREVIEAIRFVRRFQEHTDTTVISAA